MVHCFNHWFELSMKDASELDSEFTSVDQILLEMFSLTRSSGKVKTVEDCSHWLDMTCVLFIKAHRAK